MDMNQRSLTASLSGPVVDPRTPTRATADRPSDPTLTDIHNETIMLLSECKRMMKGILDHTDGPTLEKEMPMNPCAPGLFNQARFIESEVREVAVLIERVGRRL